MNRPIQSQDVRLTSADGFTLNAYHAHPVGQPVGKLVVLQEIFGVNDHIRAVCDDYAARGYDVIAPALFDRIRPGIAIGYDPESVAQGRELMAATDPEKALDDAMAAVNFLGGSEATAVVGYCWGGSLTWILGTRQPLRAAVCYYGSQISKNLDTRPLAPTLVHFGDSDASIPVSVADNLRADHPSVITHVYAAGHGFNCSARAAYVPAAAELALNRSLGLLTAVF